MVPEPFVSAQEAAKFVGISRRFLIELARRGISGAYAIGTGECEKYGYFAFPSSPLVSAGQCRSEPSDDSRKASERIIQSLGVPH